MQSLEVNSDVEYKMEKSKSESQGAKGSSLAQLCFTHSPQVCVRVKAGSFQVKWMSF